MASEPNWHPVDEDIAQILGENSGLLEELQEADRAYECGELELVPDDEVRRVLEARGIKLTARPSDPIENRPAG